MTAFETSAGGWGCRRWSHALAALALACGGGAWAEVVSVPAAHLHHTEGSVAHAPQGDHEWHDVQPRRLLKRGDRLWTDRGSRAEVQAGGHALWLNGETQLVLENASQTATQLSLTQGSIAATVTRMDSGDSFEVGTPNLAFRARQPGDYRIDVDTRQGTTRIVVLSGAGVVYGEQGEAMEVRNGQRLTFRERSLTRVQQPAFAATDDFDRWAGARKRGEPTVRMPAVAAPAAAAPAPAYTGRTIIISGTPASLAKNAPATPAAKVLPPAPVAAAVPQSAPAPVQPARPAAVMPAPAGPLRVNVPGTPAPAAAAPTQAARQQQDRQRVAQQRAEEEQRQRLAQQRAEQDRQASAARAERERRAVEAKRAEERRLAVTAAKRAEDERRQAQAKRAQEQKRTAARRAEEDRRQAQARRAAEEKRLAATRQAEAQKLAEQTRRRQLARLQEQAQREEQAAQARREQARRADEERREEARRADEARREEQARREEEYRRQRALADQWRRDHERREQEVWLRQQQHQQPVRPAPMGVPARRIS